MYGTLLTSPAGFYIIPTVRIIKVPAVTQADGQLACTTTSIWSVSCPPYPATTFSTVFTGINDYVEAYYSGQEGPSVSTDSDSHVNPKSSVVTMSRAATNTTGIPSTTVISFSTPYLYFPPEASEELIDDDVYEIILPVSIPGAVTTTSTSTTSSLSPTTTNSIDVTETITSTPTPTVNTDNLKYGFVPPDIRPWILQNPDYVRQYPDLESCLPGGPSITPQFDCVAVAPVAQELVPDLTTSGAVTVKGVGCFHPGNCPVDAAQATSTAEPASTPHAVQASSTAGPNSPSSKTSLRAFPQPENTEAQPKASQIDENPMPAIAPISEVSATEAPNPASSSSYSLPSGESGQAGDQSPQSELKVQSSSHGARSTDLADGVGASSPGAKSSPTSTQELNGQQTVGQAEGSPPKPSPAIITTTSSSIATDSSLNFMFGSNTVAPAGSPVVISSSTFSVAPSATAIIVNVAASAIQFPASSAPSTPNLGAIIAGAFTGHLAITEGSQSISLNTASQFHIGSQTLAPGSAPITVSGLTSSLDSSASAIIVNGQTGPLFVTPSLPASAAPVITINSQPITPNSVSAYIIASKTFAPGSSPITVMGTTYSLASAASAIVINGQASPLPTPPISAIIAPILTIASQSLTPKSASAYILSSRTLAPGSSPVTISGTTYSLATSASVIVINGQTSFLAASQPAPVLTLSSLPVYVFGTQNLFPGAPPITINKTPLSLAPSGSAIVVGGTTQIITAGSSPVVSVGSQTLTGSMAAQTEYVVGSLTLIPGAPGIKISGMDVSLGASATAVVVGGGTEGFVEPASTGIGNGNGSAYTGPGFTGQAPLRRVGADSWRWLGCIGLWVLVTVMPW